MADAHGLPLFGPGALGQLLAPQWSNLVPGNTPALSFSLFKDGVPVEAVTSAGRYELRADFPATDPLYSLAPTVAAQQSLVFNVLPSAASLTGAVAQLQVPTRPEVPAPATAAAPVARSAAANPATAIDVDFQRGQIPTTVNIASRIIDGGMRLPQGLQPLLLAENDRP